MQVFDIRFVSEFRYPQPVWDSHNLLRACPCSDDRQALLSYRVELSPAASVVTYQDYFGTRVDLFGVAQPHRALEVAAEIRVAMSGPAPGDPPLAPPAAPVPRRGSNARGNSVLQRSRPVSASRSTTPPTLGAVNVV